MRQSTIDEFFRLRAKAKAAGMCLSESGAPSGERRWYKLDGADGKMLMQSVSLKMIDRRLNEGTVKERGQS